jgi:hypothetical protein
MRLCLGDLVLPDRCQLLKSFLGLINSLGMTRDRFPGVSVSFDPAKDVLQCEALRMEPFIGQFIPIKRRRNRCSGLCSQGIRSNCSLRVAVAHHIDINAATPLVLSRGNCGVVRMAARQQLGDASRERPDMIKVCVSVEYHMFVVIDDVLFPNSVPRKQDLVRPSKVNHARPKSAVMFS